jgi:hypothetical protein
MKRAIAVIAALVAIDGATHPLDALDPLAGRLRRRVLRLMREPLHESCPLGRPDRPTVCWHPRRYPTPWRGV